MVETVAVREMTAADEAEVVRVSLAADRMFADAGLDLPEDDPREMLAHVRGAEGFSAVLVAGDPPVGLAALVELDGAAHLEQLAVDPAHGRRGIGSALLRAACAHAAAAGFSRLTLTTFRDLPWNAPFYAARGFAELPAENWGPGLAAQWRAEEQAGIGVAPRIAMEFRLDGGAPGAAAAGQAQRR
ncbi:GNAT family N-acetyltransferase [Nocardiopsis coralliicola]